ncbi:hypothetical protein [Rhizobium sp. PL01]|uniref:hypothetical protein n=1 Tax=Rhizobium sp. PL01 TaxID=3085631 RepID=UPI0029814438|nr:hypothetical protein [Rhizobium sp. PL01]MDW5313748.1 hypothetical protein [Rhizobium sp. PL01]
MTRSEVIRHNVKVILPLVRGKCADQRRDHYLVLKLGPIGIPLAAIAEVVRATSAARLETP